MAAFVIGAFACGGKIAPGTGPHGAINVCDGRTVCEVVSVAQVSEATGEDFLSSRSSVLPSNPIGQATCFFEAPQTAAGVGTPVVDVEFMCPQDFINAQNLMDVELANGGVTVTDVGDRAVWKTFSPDFGPSFAGQLSVIAGASTFVVLLEQDTAPDVASAKSIAQDVIANL